jgi:hypothetical protein
MSLETLLASLSPSDGREAEALDRFESLLADTSVDPSAPNAEDDLLLSPPVLSESAPSALQGLAVPVVGILETSEIVIKNSKLDELLQDGVARSKASATSMPSSPTPVPHLVTGLREMTSTERRQETMGRQSLKDLAKLANAESLQGGPSSGPGARENSGMIDLNAALGLDPISLDSGTAANSNAPPSAGVAPASVPLPGAMPTMPSMPASVPAAHLVASAPISQAPISQGPGSSPFSNASPFAQPALPSASIAPASLPGSVPPAAPLSVAPASSPVAAAPVYAAPAAQGKGKAGIIAGGVAALLLAAGVGGFVVTREKAPTLAQNVEAPKVVAAKPEAPKAEVAKAEDKNTTNNGTTKTDEPTADNKDTVDPNALPAAGKAAGSGALRPGAATDSKAFVAKTEDKAATTTDKAAEKTVDKPAEKPSDKAKPSGPVDSLDQAMRVAAGPIDGPKKEASKDEPGFAAGSVPQRPSMGSVTSAIGSALPGARACLAEGDEPVRATVVFNSVGTVKSVSASGDKASCIQAALSKAKVPAFAEPTFTTTATVRK